jgi:hypothetical protein
MRGYLDAGTIRRTQGRIGTIRITIITRTDGTTMKAIGTMRTMATTMTGITIGTKS